MEVKNGIKHTKQNERRNERTDGMNPESCQSTFPFLFLLRLESGDWKLETRDRHKCRWKKRRRNRITMNLTLTLHERAEEKINSSAGRALKLVIIWDDVDDDS